MKRLKITSIGIILFGLAVMAISILVPIIKISDYTTQNGAVGIIGGADKPTLWFLLSYSDGDFLLTFIFGLTLLLCGGFCLVFKKTVYENCRLKTTLISLCISLFGAIGLCCLFIWFSIVAFGKTASHPIEYPVSIVGGLLSLFMFIIAIAFYIKLRKNNLKIKGIIIDILTSIIALPTLFLLVAKIYSIFQAF